MRNSLVIAFFVAGGWPALADLASPIDVAWLPITDAERAMKAPLVDKDAGVEALFWKIHVRDEVVGRDDLQRVFYHYVRLKVSMKKARIRRPLSTFHSARRLPFSTWQAVQ